MIEITDLAKQQMLSRLEAVGKLGMALRVMIVGRSPDGFVYSLRFLDEEHKREDDQVIDAGGLTVLIDPKSAAYLEDATIDFVDTPQEKGFKVDNPNPLWHDPISLAIQQVLDTQINPGVAMHGGIVQLLEVKDDVAFIAMGGGCQGCGLANVTLKEGVEKAILQHVPEIRQVVDTTQHAAGTNPYYRSPAEGKSPIG